MIHDRAGRERDQLIALSLLRFLHPSRSRLLLEYFEPLTKLQQARPEAVAALLHISLDEAEQVRRAGLDHPGAQNASIALCDPEYSPLLREIVDPPLALHVLGDIGLLQGPSVAVVGSRRATPYGLNAAARLAADLAARGVTVVSGLAAGVDAAAHEAALEAGGSTIAVVGTGLDIIYPRSHRRLFDSIARKGLIVSEFAPETPPFPANFPIRNRVISGLSLGTVIVEASVRSGSLITARMAAEQGREVFVVPGSIFSAKSEGSHRLIQYGAKLVIDVADIFDELPQIHPSPVLPAPEGPANPLLECIPLEEPMHIDRIASRMEKSAAELAEPLMQLEIDGRIRACGGGRYVRLALERRVVRPP